MAGRGQQFAVIFGILLGSILFILTSRHFADADLDRAGMGRNTVPRSGVFGEFPVSAVGQPETIFPVWEQFRQKSRTVALWLGASQVYCINNIQPDDRLAVEYVNQWALDYEKSLRMTQLTAPNGNLHELLAFYLASRQAGYRPDWLVIALTYDDLREEDIRETFLQALAPIEPATLQLGGQGVAQLEVRRKALSSADDNQDPVARNPTTGTPQAKLEEVLVASLEKHVPAYADRHKLTGQFKITVRAGLSRIFGRVSQRRVAAIGQARKEWHHRALIALVNIARADGCQILVYKPPHRPSKGPFYHDREQYDAYFERVAAWCETMPEVFFLDLETLVPPQYWGVTNWGRPDVFHFTVAGHRRLGDAIAAFFEDRLTEDPSAVQ